MPSNHLGLCHPFFFLPSIIPSIRVFPSESVVCIRWPKYWSFSIKISPSNEYLRLISFRIDWFDLFAVQKIFTSLLQNRNSEALSLLYGPTHICARLLEKPYHFQFTLIHGPGSYAILFFTSSYFTSISNYIYRWALFLL